MSEPMTDAEDAPFRAVQASEDRGNGGRRSPACVHCGHALQRVEGPRSVHWECPACEGQVISFAVLGAWVERPYLKQLWNSARQAKERSGRPCCHCGERMVTVAPPGTGGPEVDVCTRCVWVWLDRRELVNMPALAADSVITAPRLISTGMPLKATPRPSQDRSLEGVLIVTLAAAMLIVAGVNLAWWGAAPSASTRSAETLRAAGFPDRAESVFLELLDESPLDLDLNHLYILNHFAIRSTENEPRDDEGIERRYQRLSERVETRDLGDYGLGLNASHAGRDTQALAHYDRVANRRQRHLNGSIGRSLLRLGRMEEAELAWIREIEVGGDVADAVANLARLYRWRQDLPSLQRLIADPRTGSSVPREIRREASLRTGQLADYLATDLALVREIPPQAAITALVIAAMWFLFLWRIDIFEQEPFGHSLLVFGLGGASVFVSLLFTELIAQAVPALGPVSWWLYSGLPEEVAKILPVLAIARASWHVNEPVDLLVYGSLSALGFATMENAAYFRLYGPEIAIPRFLSSTIGHMALTGLVCHLLGRARFVHRRGGGAALAKGLVLAVFLHGLSNFLVANGWMVLDAIAMAGLYGWMIRNALSWSPYYHDSLATSSRLRNYELLAATAIVLVLIAFLSDQRELGTALADQRLLQVAGSFWLAVSVFVIVGKLGLSGRASAGKQKAGEARP